MEKQTLQEMNFLLPIIIGSVVALVLIITVIFLVVKSKKDKTKYDEEKANGATEESRKLNIISYNICLIMLPRSR